MSRAAAAARTRTPHARRATAPPRRVSGPVRSRSGAAAVAAPPPLALRLGGAIHGIAEHRWLDRIIRGRAWIAILAVGLIGIVFMQVSMLRLNAGIGANIEQASKLERENSAMRATLSELTSGDRIEAEAAKLGFVLPPAGAARFLSARGFDPARALADIQLPSHLAPLPVGTASTVTATTVAALPATGVAPGATAANPATTAPTATATTPATVPSQSTAPTQATATPAATAAPVQSTATATPPSSASTTPPPSGGATAAATATPTTTGGVAPTGAR